MSTVPSESLPPLTRKERDQLQKEQRLLRNRLLVGTKTRYEDQERLAEVTRQLQQSEHSPS